MSSLQHVRTLLQEALAHLAHLEAEATLNALPGHTNAAAAPQSWPTQEHVGGVKLDLSQATPAGRLPEHYAEGPVGAIDAPSSYVLIGADSPWVYERHQFIATEHGGATLIHPQYALTAAHVVCQPDGRGGFESTLSELRCSVAAGSRSVQTERFACNEVWIHPYYEGTHTNLRFDLALIRLPEPSMHQPADWIRTSNHTIQPNEVLRYYGMGLRSPGGALHETIHSGTMIATENVRQQVVELQALSDTFEQGFSGGPMYDADEGNLWVGTISGYLPPDEYGNRVSHIIPATFSHPWAMAQIAQIEAERNQWNGDVVVADNNWDNDWRNAPWRADAV